MSNNYFERPAGPIINDPRLENFELIRQLDQAMRIPHLQDDNAVREALQVIITGEETLDNAPNDRFIAHERDITLNPENHDPLEALPAALEHLRELQRQHDLNQRSRRQRDRHLRLLRAGFTTDPQTGTWEAAESAWEDPRAIFQGETLCLAQYGPSSGVLANTSLELDTFPLERTRIHRCRAQDADDTIYNMGWVPYLASDLDRLPLLEAQELRQRAELEVVLDKAHEDIKKTQALVPQATAKLFAAADAWAAAQSAEYGKWEKHVANAHKCSTALARVWQIVSWYRLGLPSELSEAVSELSGVHGKISTIRKVIADTECELGADKVKTSEQLADDELWQSCKLEKGDPLPLFGWDFDLAKTSMNGFASYIPPTTLKGAALAEHALAHHEVRKIRLEHFEESEKPDRVDLAYAHEQRFVENADHVLKAEKARLLEESKSNPSYDADLAAVGDVLLLLTDYIEEVIVLRNKKAAADGEVPDSWDDEVANTINEAASTSDSSDTVSNASVTQSAASATSYEIPMSFDIDEEECNCPNCIAAQNRPTDANVVQHTDWTYDLWFHQPRDGGGSYPIWPEESDGGEDEM